MSGFILAIDQGTTSTRAIVFDSGYRIRGLGQQEFPQHFPRSGWVEHDARDLWRTTVETVRTALAQSGIPATEIAGCGITNQRETTLLWDRETGQPVGPAIVWQDRRTAEICAALKSDGIEADVTARTGLLLDPYFSGTKLAWLLDNVEGARARAEQGRLAFGTVDSWLLWNLTGGKVHATEVTNAARTLLFNIAQQEWDPELLRLFRIPAAVLPDVYDTAYEFGTIDPALFGAPIPILGIAGDQQAATMGQACFTPGMTKSTYGTGCFTVLNTGPDLVPSRNRLLTTIAYRLDGHTTYALEGSIFVAGAAVQWLRDGLRILERADQSAAMAAAADPNQDVYLVPAFTGLGAPHWDADARGALFGLTRSTGPNELARAALEAVCYQTCDLVDAMRRDWTEGAGKVMRVDGGMVANDLTMQWLADLLDAPVDRPAVLETTSLGAAWLAGRQAGVWPGEEGFAESWRRERRFEPSMDAATRARKLAGWRDAVERTVTRAQV